VFDGNYPGGDINVTSTVVHSENSAFVFDSLLYPEDTLELLRSLRGFNLNPEGLVNTHWHLDHTAGNHLFLETKRILSHGLCSDLMRKGLPAQISSLNEELKSDQKVKVVYPNEEVSEGSVITLGGLRIRLLHTPGHTPDSIIAWLEDEHVIIAGDAVMELPYIGYGESQALVKSLRRIQSLDKRAKIIQGHGRVCTPEKLKDDVSYIENVRKLVGEYLISGKSANESAAEIKLVDCIGEKRTERLPRLYEEIHQENVGRIHAELVRRMN
jgi:glyoxylase-like metal-dependent hydrolase (beta-lactamase superfamily II)